MTIRKPAIGLVFGKVQVTEEAPDHFTPTQYKRMVKCSCACGRQFVTSLADLKNGRVRSCGCARKETNDRIFLKHGHSRKGKLSKLYMVWASMKYRCIKPKNKAWKNYGGRGIKVCLRWQESFKNFLDDMGTPQSGLTLERKDNNGDYTPENCCWATRSQQSRNKRTNRIFTVNGITGCIADLAHHFGADPDLARSRFYQGWPTDRIFIPPTRSSSRARPQ